MIEKLCLNPAKILGIDKGKLTPGSIADMIIISDQETWKVAKQNLISKSKNSAFLQQSLKGLIDYTICGGKVLYKR